MTLRPLRVLRQGDDTMRAKSWACAVLILGAGLSLGCASSEASKYLHHVQSHSVEALILRGGELGVLPFDCTDESIGEVISKATAEHLAPLRFKIVDSPVLSQRLEKLNVDLAELAKNKDYDRLGPLTNVDYLLVGEVRIHSPGTKEILSATARILDPVGGNTVIEAKLVPPQGTWEMSFLGEILAEAIKNEVMKGIRY